MKKNIILKSLKETFSLIRKHKLLILVLFLLQILFFSVLTFTQINYQVAIATNLQSMSQSLDNLALDDETIAQKISEKGDILDISGIYASYDKIMETLRILIIVSFLIFAVMNGINWAFTDNLIKKKSIKQFFTYLWKFILLALLYGVVILTLLFLFIRTAFMGLETGDNPVFIALLLILGLVAFYFMFISFALIGKANLKDIFKKTFKIGIKKAHVILLAYMMNLAVIVLFFYLLYLIIEVNFVLFFIVTLLFFFIFVLTRIFFILVVDKLRKLF